MSELFSKVLRSHLKEIMQNNVIMTDITHKSIKRRFDCESGSFKVKNNAAGMHAIGIRSKNIYNNA